MSVHEQTNNAAAPQLMSLSCDPLAVTCAMCPQQRFRERQQDHLQEREETNRVRCITS